MAHFPDDDLTPRRDPLPDEDSAAARPVQRPTGDAEDTAPAFNPIDPESSWMAFLTPPAIDLDEDGVPDVQQAPPVVTAQPDADATAAALGDQVKTWLTQDENDAAPVDPLAGLAAVQPGVVDDAAAAVPAERDELPTADADTAAARLTADLAQPPIAVVERPTEPEPLPVQPPAEPAVQPAQPAFEDLTVAATLGRLWQAPGATFDALLNVLQATEPGRERVLKPAYAGASAPAKRTPVPAVPVRVPQPEPVSIPRDDEDRAAFDRAGLRKALLIGAFILGLIGTLIMQTTGDRSETVALLPGLPFLGMALLAAFAAEFFGGVLRPDQPAVLAQSAPHTQRSRRTLITRLGIAAFTVSATLMTLLLNRDNTFTPLGVVVWAISIIAVIGTFAPAGWRPINTLRLLGGRVRALGRVELGNLTLIGLVVALAIGAFLRLGQLDAAPREMTSDHVEMLLDSNRVLNGQSYIFLSNIGGREPMQFYLLALLSNIPGLGMTFTTQKLLTAVQGVLLLPLLWWLGREAIGPRQPRLGNTTGVLMALLVAIGFWPLLLSRLGERIALTPIFVALILIFLIRGLRSGHRWDFILTGLFLGIGLYTYQVIRIMPLVIVAGVGIALVAYVRHRAMWPELVKNLFVTALVAFVIFMPLFGYSVEHPEEFWRRTSGRLFGEDEIQTIDAAGNTVYRSPTTEERITALVDNVPVLLLNLRNAVMMYNWRGDVAWFQNYSNTPAFDPVTGGLLVVGLGAWITRMIRRRDPGDWALAFGFGILLLPSALSVGFPIENPSFTRLSGTLPIVYLWTAYPLALLFQPTNQRGLVQRLRPALSALALVSVIAYSLSVTQHRYFTLYAQQYQNSVFPYSDAGFALANFAESGPGYGNAFIIAYDFWWDHRAVGLEAGQINWPNTIPELEELPQVLLTAYERSGNGAALDINADLLFFYHPDDTEAETRLLSWFPNGISQTMTTYQPEDTYRLFRVPALNAEGFRALLLSAGIEWAEN